MLRLKKSVASKHYPAKILFGCWGLSCISAISHAQTPEILDALIFDAFLLEGHLPESVTVRGRGGEPLPDYTGALESEKRIEKEQQLPILTDLAEDINYYQGVIFDLERNAGNFDPGLIQNLLALGSLHQQQNQHESAISYFERADHVSRINNGLYHPEQIPVIEGMIESYLALDDFSAAYDKQRYLVFLNRKMAELENFSMVKSLSALGDSNMERFDVALLEKEVEKSGFKLNLLTAMSGLPDIQDPSRNYAVSSLLQAKNTYFEAITSMLRNRDYLDPQLLELEYKFLETLFLLGYRIEIVQDPHYYLTRARYDSNIANRWKFLRRNKNSYLLGLDSYQRILQYFSINASITSQERVNAMLELGDWHLLFDRSDSAIRQYEAAYRLSSELELDSNQMKQLFDQDYPLQLPLFTPRPNSREKFSISPDTPLTYSGYIDLSFNINRIGTVKNIKILDKSAGTTYPVENRLKLYLKNSPFRPQIVEGKVTKREAIYLRYFYTFR